MSAKLSIKTEDRETDRDPWRWPLYLVCSTITGYNVKMTDPSTPLGVWYWGHQGCWSCSSSVLILPAISSPSHGPTTASWRLGSLISDLGIVGKASYFTGLSFQYAKNKCSIASSWGPHGPEKRPLQGKVGTAQRRPVNSSGNSLWDFDVGILSCCFTTNTCVASSRHINNQDKNILTPVGSTFVPHTFPKHGQYVWEMSALQYQCHKIIGIYLNRPQALIVYGNYVMDPQVMD